MKRFDIKKEILLSIGMIFWTSALILGSFLPDILLISFLEGLFTSLSLVMNVSYLLKTKNIKV
ncbi:MAG: hypothetical protein ACXABO_12115 [Promethearchaeota archaeon]